MRVQIADVTQIDSKSNVDTPLDALYAQHRGKVADKWSTYLREYDRILRDYRHRPVRLLEIGIQNGGSLEIWAEYFSKATAILGCDIDPNCERLSYADPRIAVLVGDANTDDVQRRVVEHTRQLDIVIDDGSHHSRDIVRSFARYFPLLSEHGIFIIEDLHCSYWQELSGGLFHPHAAMTFLKRLADVVNHEHWGVPKLRNALVRGIADQYDVRFHDQELGQIHSIEFSNSMCVIRKAPTDENALGTRVIVGDDEPVVEGIRAFQAMARPEAPDQSGNVWSTPVLPPEEDLTELREAAAPLAGYVARVGELEAEVERRGAEITRLQQELEQQRQRADAHGAEHARFALERETWQAALANHDRRLLKELSASAATRTALQERSQEHRQAVQDRDGQRRRARRLSGELEQARAELTRMQRSLSWQFTAPLRRIDALTHKLLPGPIYRASRRLQKIVRQQGPWGATKHLLSLLIGQKRTFARPQAAPTKALSEAAARTAAAPATFDRNNYPEWLRRYDTLSDAGRAALAARALAFPQKPLISVVMPTYNSNLAWLEEAIHSVRSQLYPFWELCIVDDASTNPVLRAALEQYARDDPRIRVKFREKNGHICATSNDGLQLAQGEWIALLDHDDILREHALFWVADAINDNPRARIIYSDEDKLGAKGERCEPYFKSDWNPDLFLSHNMISHLGVFAADLLREVGGFRLGYEGSQDYDLALRCVERLTPPQIHHVPRVLYTWRVHAASTSSTGEAKPYALLAGKRAVEEYLERKHVKAEVSLNEFSQYRVKYALPEQPPLVSIIIPTRNALKLVHQCIESIIERTCYDGYEIILVDNGSDDPDALKYFAELEARPKVRVLRDDRPFNYSALNNAAVHVARGEYVCLVNNDIEVISPDWLDELLRIAIQPGVGAVGARLWYPNDHLQHGGVIVGLGGVAAHSHKNIKRGTHGYCGRASLIQTLSAVTGACLMLKKSTYAEVGGLNESDLKIAFNDVDLCLKVREAGYRNVWTPYADLYHHESATRGIEDTAEKKARFLHEIHYMQSRWADVISADPAYSPNLTVSHEDFSYAWPPRLSDILLR